MTPAELADRVGHYACTVEGSVVLDRAKIDVATGLVTAEDRPMELVRITLPEIERHGQRYTKARTAGDVRVMVAHLRHVANEWERAAALADELVAAKPRPTAPPKLPRRHKRGPAARWEHLDMDPPASETVSAGER